MSTIIQGVLGGVVGFVCSHYGVTTSDWGFWVLILTHVAGFVHGALLHHAK